VALSAGTIGAGRVRRLGALTVAIVGLVWSSEAAHADDAATKWNDALDRGIISRPHTTAEFEAGAIVLPSEPIAPAQRGGNLPAGLHIGKGDATIQIGAHFLYRATPIWAVGATVLFAPSPTEDTSYGLGGSSGLSRTHSRDYFFVGGEGRFVPLHYKLFEGWIGAQLGGIIVADRFTTTNAGTYEAPVGYPQVNERTEGLSGGAQVGLSYSFGESFIVGFTLRASVWYLPSTPNCSAIGDCATLTNSTFVAEGGFLFGYRLPL
jgi:hypothetical protein